MKLEEQINGILTIEDMPNVVRADELLDYMLVERKRWVKQLSTLIQKEREEAVREFAKWCDSMSYEYEDSGGNAMVIEELTKTYLAQTKGGEE